VYGHKTRLWLTPFTLKPLIRNHFAAGISRSVLAWADYEYVFQFLNIYSRASSEHSTHGMSFRHPLD